MKKIIIALAALLVMQYAGAQVKSPADAKKAVEAAEAAAADVKKADKVATWLKLASTYLDAYTSPMGAGWRGASKAELKLVLNNDPVVSTEDVVLGNTPYTKDVYATRNYYFNPSGILEIIEVTQPVYEDALAKALDAYKKAHEVDEKGTKTKDISAGIADIESKYMDDGVTRYMFGDLKGASRYFEAAVEASECEPYATLDSVALYNAGFTAWQGGEPERALKFFEKCLQVGYYENGEVYSKLGDIYTRDEKEAQAKAVLEEGFTKFPESQSILIGLINYYVNSEEDTDQLFALLDKAKENEPNNASLYYVEGDIHLKLGQKEEAIASYSQASTINPDYEFGYIGIGMLYYNEAIDLSEQAQEELDDAKYDALVEQFEAALLNALDPFEKAFEISKDAAIKSSIAEYLKNIYYRFQERDEKYVKGYEKYNSYIKGE